MNFEILVSGIFLRLATNLTVKKHIRNFVTFDRTIIFKNSQMYAEIKKKFIWI